MNELPFRLQINPLMITLFVIFFGVFSALSIWQVMRVYEKQAISERIEFANAEIPVVLAELPAMELDGYRFYRAITRGHFKVEACFYVENVIRNGKPGLYLYCPFQPSGTEYLLLVNMGWMTRPRERFDLPDIHVESGQVAIEGVIQRPRSKPVVVVDGRKPNMERENLWAYFDFEYLNNSFDGRLYPIELQLTTALEPKLERDWIKYDPKIGMHIGYAIHWAAFALVTLGLYVKFNVKKIERDD